MAEKSCPVPPYCEDIAEACQVPLVIVPTVTKATEPETGVNPASTAVWSVHWDVAES